MEIWIGSALSNEKTVNCFAFIEFVVRIYIYIYICVLNLITRVIINSITLFTIYIRTKILILSINDARSRVV